MTRRQLLQALQAPGVVLPLALDFQAVSCPCRGAPCRAGPRARTLPLTGDGHLPEYVLASCRGHCQKNKRGHRGRAWKTRPGGTRNPGWLWGLITAYISAVNTRTKLFCFPFSFKYKGRKQMKNLNFCFLVVFHNAVCVSACCSRCGAAQAHSRGDELGPFCTRHPFICQAAFCSPFPLPSLRDGPVWLPLQATPLR